MKKIIIIVLAIFLGSCNYLDVEPVGQVMPRSVDDYRAMLTSAYNGSWNYRYRLAWPSDEVGDLASDFGTYTSTILNVTWRADNNLAQENSYQDFYKAIFYTNEIIDKIDNAEQDGSTDSKSQIKAEAYAIRAYCYFDLLNIYAKWYDASTASTDLGVPVTTSIDIKQKFPRLSVEEVYKQIFSDLEQAINLMEVDSQPKEYNYRFSKISLSAFEARVRLYRGEWDKALTLAEKVIGSTNESSFCLENMLVDGYEKPYSSKSKEAILALEKPFIPLVFDLQGTLLSERIVSLFGEGDARTDVYMNKSEINTPDFSCFMDVYRFGKEKERVSIRLSEIYLIAAEAAAKKANPDLEKVKLYLNELQEKRIVADNLKDLNILSKEELLNEIADERARELIGEGHRWFDLKRTTRPSITKKLLKTWYFNWDTFEEIKEYDEYVLNENDNRYILPFPRSAKEINPYLN
jgi:SusD family.